MREGNIIDISLPIHTGMIVYPGNPPVTIRPEKGETTFRSLITFGSHTGTHIDAPRHSFRNGRPIDRIPLETFFGVCRVLDMTHERHAVTIASLKKARVRKGERILFKTRNSKRGYKRFYSDYIYLDGDGAEYLAHIGIKLVGIDHLSIKQKGSTDTRPHESLLKKNIPIIEGLNLSRVIAGTYTLAALPLKCAGLDGSPARVVLIK